jgi:low temperature requirement protein LtrA
MIRRSRSRSKDRFTVAKTAIFFLAGGIWLAGVLANDLRITGAAIVILVIGLVLRLFPGKPAEHEGGDAGE